MQAVAELEARVDELIKDKTSRQQAQQRLEVEVARLKEGISKNRVGLPFRLAMWVILRGLIMRLPKPCWYSKGLPGHPAAVCVLDFAVRHHGTFVKADAIHTEHAGYAVAAC